MIMHRVDRFLLRLLIIALVAPGVETAVAAPTGTYNSNTITVTDQSTAKYTLKVAAADVIIAPVVTRLWTQVGTDNKVTQLTSAAISNVKVILSLGAISLNLTDAQIRAGFDDFAAATFTGKRIQASSGAFDLNAASNVYRIEITHKAPLAADETWTVSFENLPTGSSPPIRTIAFVQRGYFTDVTPSGVCGGASCPAGQTCRWSPCLPDFDICKKSPLLPQCRIFDICQKKPWLCEPSLCEKRPWLCEPLLITQWPLVHIPLCLKCPPPPCLSCPSPWKDPVKEGFDRVVVAFTPFDRESRALGTEKADQIQLSIKGGEPVGGIVDMGNGQYLQLIEYRKGEPPRVSATAAGVTSEEIVAGPESHADARVYEILTYVLSALLLAALAGIAWLMRRRGGAPRA